MSFLRKKSLFPPTDAQVVGTGGSKIPVGVFLFLCSLRLPFWLDVFLHQWEVRLKKSNNALAKLLMIVQNGALQCLPQLEDRWPWHTKSLHLLFGIKSNVLHICTGVNEVFSAKLYTWKSGEERLRFLKHNLAPSCLHWTWLFIRQLRKLKMS